jgi:hypothetical protein
MPYIWMSLAVLFVQIFLLDNINIGASVALWMRPMIFPLIVLLLPMQWKMIWVMLVAYVVGYLMDISLGGEGLYVATLLPLALIRPTLIYIIGRHSVDMTDEKHLLARLSAWQLMLYIVSALLIHHTLFFFLEALSLSHFMQVMLTILFSLLLSTIMGWFVVRLFISKVLVR